MKAPAHKSYLRVGITGGIGSGKSTACRLFAGLGRTIISADRIAADLVDHDDAVRQRIRKTFGDTIYQVDGLLDRKRLASIVFTDPSLRKKLNAIVHPRVIVSIDQHIDMLPEHARKPYVLIEAALIYESGMDKKLDYTIVVDAMEEIRIQRVMDRDGCPREEVLRRIQAQMPAGQKRKKADFVVQNDSNEADLAPRIEFLDKLITLQATARNVP